MSSEKESLFKEWIKFKKAEDKAKKARNEIEEQIVSVYGEDFPGQSKTFQQDDIGYKLTIKKNIVYKLDQEKWKAIRNDIPENMRPEKVSFSLDVKGFEWLSENDKDLYKHVSDCVEVKTNKSTIKVEKK